LNDEEYKYCIIKDNIIYIKSDFKQKKKEYGIVTLNKKLIDTLQESIDLLSRSPLISPKFSERIETFLLPRFAEIIEILYTMKTLPPEIGIEITRENLKDINKGLTSGSVITKLDEKGYSANELKETLKEVKFAK